jgi:hypothetical protein
MCRFQLFISKFSVVDVRREHEEAAAQLGSGDHDIVGADRCAAFGQRGTNGGRGGRIFRLIGKYVQVL